MALGVRREVGRWLLAPALIASLGSAASAQPGLHRLLYKPYPVVRAALIKQGYLPLAQTHAMDNDACLDDADPCRKWPEIAEFTNAFERFMFVFADRRRGGESPRRKLVIVIANGGEFEVSAIRLANKDDRDELSSLAMELREEREMGLPTWEESPPIAPPNRGSKAR